MIATKTFKMDKQTKDVNVYVKFLILHTDTVDPYQTALTNGLTDYKGDDIYGKCL